MYYNALMHSFIFRSADDLPKELPHPADTLHVRTETSIGIDEVRDIQRFLSRKPTQGGINAVIVHDAHLLTIPAQHAFLKTLEEPPPTTQIYLITAYADQLLPTILSRVQVMDADTPTQVPDTSHAQELLENLMKATLTEKMELLDKANFTRDSALEFLSHVEHIIHKNLSLHYLYASLDETRKYLKANVSVKAAMDHFAFSLKSAV